MRNRLAAEDLGVHRNSLQDPVFLHPFLPEPLKTRPFFSNTNPIGAQSRLSAAFYFIFVEAPLLSFSILNQISYIFAAMNPQGKNVFLDNFYG